MADPIFFAPLLNNTTLVTGSGSASATRATIGAIVDSATGLLSTAAINTVRHDSIYGALLNSESRTNNLLYSRDLSFGGTKVASSILPYWYTSVTGSELVTNGTFDTTTTGWSAINATLSSVSSVLRITPTTVNGQARQTITTITGTVYTITGTLTNINGSAAAHKIQVGSTAGGTDLGSFDSRLSPGSAISMLFTAAGTSTFISLYSAESTLYHEWDNITVKKAAIQPVLNQTGIDGSTNSCTLLTAAAADATIFQNITAASTPACSSFYVKRSVGTGTISFTRDGGTTWTDITSLINSSTFTCVKIENTSVTNPSVGFKISTSGDAIIVDYGQNEAGTDSSMPILTTTAATTRNADALTYQTSGNFSDTAGTIVATVRRENWANNNGSVVGSATRGLYTSASNSGAQALDGTNTVNGTAGTPSGKVRMAASWSGSTLKVCVGGAVTSGSYDGSFNLSSIAIMPGTIGYIKNVAIWGEAKTDQELIDLTNDTVSKSLTGIAVNQSLGSLNIATRAFALAGNAVTQSIGSLSMAARAFSLSGLSTSVQRENIYTFIDASLIGVEMIVSKGSIRKQRLPSAFGGISVSYLKQHISVDMA